MCGKERFLELTEVQLQQARHRVQVFGANDILQRVLACNQRQTNHVLQLERRQLFIKDRSVLIDVH